jgi:hypothetical protein
MANLSSMSENNMTTFADIVDAAGSLPTDEQQRLIEILQRRLAEESRKQLRRDVDAARAEHLAGASSPTSVGDLMNEIRRDS